MSKTQKILLAAIVLLALTVAGFAVYYLYFKKTPTVIQGPGQQQGTTTLPQGNIEIIDSKLKKISATAAISPTTTADGKRVVYMGKSGGITELDFTGENAKETKFVALQNLFSVSWNKDRTEFAASYETSEGRQLRYYKTAATQTAPYALNIKRVAFSKTENKIAYHAVDASQNANAIFVANADGSNAKSVFSNRLQDARLAWIGAAKIAVSTAPSGLAQNLLWLLDTETQKITSVLSNINGLTFLWGPPGNRFIFSKTTPDGKNLTLYSANTNGADVKKLDFETLPEKCAFSDNGETLVCAVPKITPDILWPDDYYKKQYDAQEQIWKIDLASGKKDLLYEFAADKNFDVANLVLSQSEDYLVFTNRKDDYLYSLKLK
ncbi:hypothetical protein A3C91_03695 [Candidatus Azambacteria bacterium RIFCSPHIGHO2_02_FULL_52_12]|uniref:Dipeptidylpeptidase IV N-terminal domain-containing protein n=1 Tax=Candidatus Azambacteria bacterium RIFCSPLOWO2_01_FULL_46_25 TaxID=1797298 RepID=A0A1F5BUQ9_9BACT|nr:MAG: hypothetical protein A3C91_03695 [Candidatus Azambacteria bacterium RIFCSPHIGHO2_02_FULL_52_12]OGD34366.1 MAG: hypothetical protein A2988_02455 [Candidatus Azambacteria bacterium RIFCSPLOWO2_01_FULL_46_25]OGD37356.1 MAG: hypothetical protein A2850_01430 [Candidatus Azambacteria bacterium RIFCSPHIGHO2_01_FULL_51_74]